MDLLLTYKNATGLFVGKEWTGIVLIPQTKEEEKLLYRLLQKHDVIGPNEILEVGKGEDQKEYFTPQLIKKYGGKKVLVCSFGPRE